MWGLRDQIKELEFSVIDLRTQLRDARAEVVRLTNKLIAAQKELDSFDTA